MAFPTEFKPKQVSKYLKISSAQLNRQVANTIGQPARPARKAGEAAGFSLFNALLMRLGMILGELGLLPHRVRACTSEVEQWLIQVLDDPRFVEEPRDPDFELNQMYRWLIGKQTTEGFAVRLIDKDELTLFLASKETGQPHVLIALYHFLDKEMESLEASLRTS